MESIVAEDSPLGAYLEGRGEPDEPNEEFPQPEDHGSRSFAPPNVPLLRHAPIPKKLLASKPVSEFRRMGALAVSMTLGKEDNERFLEHFRYIFIASQLLNERVEPSLANSTPPLHPANIPDLRNSTSTFTGAIIVAAVAFALVWIINWSRAAPSSPASRVKIGCVVLLLLVAALVSHAYGRRQWLKHVRQRAVESGTSFVERMQMLETSTATVLSLIQDVEVVSRGYSISYPLAPVSRLEKPGELRRCARLRRKLQATYEGTISAFAHSIRTLQTKANADSLERFLEVYDVEDEDLHEAWTNASAATDEVGSLKCLRVEQYRLGILRRLLVCVLLSLPATGLSSDRAVWLLAVQELERLSTIAGEQTELLTSLINDDDSRLGVVMQGGSSANTWPDLTPQTPVARTSKPTTDTPKQQRLQSQLRRMNTLSSGIRSIQAKIYMLRDDSTRALSSSSTEPELSAISASLKQQYDALGADLRSLLKAWDAGKTALAREVDQHGRRISRSSSIGTQPGTPRAPLSPAFSSLGIVDESSGSGLTGLGVDLSSSLPMPLSPPATEDGSSDTGPEEVFEAVAVPRGMAAGSRQRSGLGRDERIRRAKEERARAASMRESQETGLKLVRELQDVIRLRPQGVRRSMPATAAPSVPDSPSPSHGRMTSV